MSHSSTERLIEYWEGLKIGGRIPSRAALDPAAFRDLMPQVFILGRDAAGAYPFRLVGGFLAELHRRDLRGDNMLDLWDSGSRTDLVAALETGRAMNAPALVTADIHATGVATVGMEVLFLPLTATGGEVDRYLGLYQPIAMVERLLGRPADSLSLRREGASADFERPALRLVALEGRRLA